MAILDPVHSVLSEYHSKHDMTLVEISVDKLRPIFEDMGFVDKIIWERFFFDTEYIAAQIKTHNADLGPYKGVGSYARIQFAQNLNYCWTRFVLCKEMWHCVLDAEPGTRITSTADLLKLSEYLSDDLLAHIADEAHGFPPFNSEELAEIMAIETLFPMELRRHLCDPLDEGKISPLQIALRYRIPQEYVHVGMGAAYFSSALRGRGDKLVAL